jgi:spermidine synthase
MPPRGSRVHSYPGMNAGEVESRLVRLSTSAAILRDALARTGLAVALFSSGAASLMYQVAWTRRLVSVTSATPAAQAVVVAFFMAGLGLGAAWAGRRATAQQRPLFAYAVVELGAAVCAALSLPAIRAVGSGAPMWLSMSVSGVLLLATASLLGASLPFVLEYARRRAKSSDAIVNDRMVGLLYGTNTLGAVSGALLAGFVTIEPYGLRVTTLLGCGLTLLAVVIAGGMGRGALPFTVPSVSAPPPARSRRPNIERRLIACATLSGLAGVGSEIVYTRLLALIVQNTVYLFAEVLAGVLVGIAAGGFVAAAIVRRASRSSRALSATVVGLAAAAVLIASSPTIVLSLVGTETFDVGVATGSLLSGLAVFAIVAPPAACIAIALPLLVVAWRASSSSEAFGLLYAANTAGSVAGSLVAGFVLLPHAGLAVAVSAMALAAIAAAGALGLGRRMPLDPKRVRVLWGLLAGATAIVVLFQVSRDMPRAIYEAHIPPGTTILEFKEGTVSDAMVTQDRKGNRRLWINSAWVAGTGGGHDILGHLPALFVPEPRSGLGIALGTGQTFAAMTRHGLSTLDCVELNPSVILLAGRWFDEANDHLFEQRGVRVHCDDGRAFMRASDHRFDLVVLEPLQAWTAGTANLYTREFYEEARRVLTPGGVVAQWIPFYGQTELDTRAMVHTGSVVFRSASLWLSDNDGILLLSDAPFVLDPEALDARMRARGVDTLLEQDGIGSASDLVALFLLGPEGVHRWTDDAPVIDDDHPFLEFSAARNFKNPNSRRIFASVRDRTESPAAYMRADAANAQAVVTAARAVQGALLEAGTLPYGDHDARAKALERAFAEAPGSTLLSARYGREVREWVRSAKSNGSLLTPAGIYERAIQRDPRQGEALVDLARLDLERGQLDDATRLLLRAKEVARVRGEAEEVLGRLDQARH